MSHFLWIEDFDNSTKTTANNVLGSIFDDSYFAEEKRKLRENLEQYGVFIELSFQDGLSFIRQQLHKIDYVILDINLPAISEGDTINDEVLKLLTDFQDYQKQADEEDDEKLLTEKCKELREIAGFYLYTELVVELGFPKDHILFCSDHGEEVKSIKEAFESAKIALPPIYKKANPEVQQWVKTRFENPYSRLRRGIIEACQYLKNQKDKLRFDKFCKDGKNAFLDIDDYLATLGNFLPLREPSDKKTLYKLYKLFIRTLAHEWEESVEPKALDDKGSFAFSWVMKMTRNWIAHNSTAIFTNLTEQDITYLFICNMRALFDLDDTVQSYEKHLFSLFDIKADTENKIRNKNIPLIDTYVSYFNEKTNRTDVHNILNDLQNDKYKLQNKGNEFFITGLYHCFWFLTSSHNNQKDKAKPNRDKPNQVFISRYYSFEFFDYTKTDFLFEIARRIYSRSFLP